MFRVRGYGHGRRVGDRAECGPEGQVQVEGLTVELTVVAYLTRAIVADPGTDPPAQRSLPVAQ